MKNEIFFNGWKITHLPVEYTLADYQQAREEIKQKISQIPEVIALFEFGTIPAPGISDMDFFVVFKDGCSKIGIPNACNFSVKTKYLMEHKLFIVPSETLYKNILLLDPWATYFYTDKHSELYFTKDIRFRSLIDLDEKEKKILSAIFIIDQVNSIFTLLPFYKNKELPVRQVFELLKNNVFSLEEVNLLFNQQVIKSDFTQKFKELRSSWFRVDQKEGVERLIEILKEGLLLAFEISWKVADFLKPYITLESFRKVHFRRPIFFLKNYSDKINKIIYFQTFKYSRIFTSHNLTFQEAFDLSLKMTKDYQINLGYRKKTLQLSPVLQPIEIASILSGISSGEGVTSSRIRKDLYTIDDQVPVLKSLALDRRVAFVNESCEAFFSKNKAKEINGKLAASWAGDMGYFFNREGILRKWASFYLKKKLEKEMQKIINSII